MQRWRQQRMLQRQGRLDESGDARGGIQMPDVAFDRSQCAELSSLGSGGERLCEPGDFDGVTQRRCRAMALHIADAARIDVGHGMGHFDDGRLAVTLGAVKPTFDAPSLLTPEPRTMAVNMIAVGDGVLETLQEHHAATVAKDGAGRVGIEGTARAVRGNHAALEVLITPLLRERDGDSAGERHVRLIEEQALTCLCDGQQRGRAGGRQREARTSQIELVRNAGRQKVVSGAQQRGVGAHLVIAGEFFDRAALAQHIAQEVGIDARAAENADRTAVRRRIVAGILQRLP